jgi:imidazoleglycerol-phosphate dehydratase
MKTRKAVVKRKTRETDIRLAVNLDGKGAADVCTGIGIFDHMLELFARHSHIDLEIAAKGDLQIDAHHTVEDIGICLGEGIKKALGRKEGIVRYGFCNLPMDEALASVAIDLSGRPYLRYGVKPGRRKIGSFDLQLIEEFFQAFVNNAGVTLHIEMLSGKNPHHIIEAVFKGVARALASAVGRSGREKGIPSTKGRL